MGTLHRLPTSHRSPGTGYCLECGFPMEWPDADHWPETCPMGCTPLVLASTAMKGVQMITDGTGKIIGTIDT